MEAAYQDTIEQSPIRAFVNTYLRTSAESAVQNARFIKYAPGLDAMSLQDPSALLLTCTYAAHAKKERNHCDGQEPALIW
jgi:hypothetical protein